MLFGAHRIQKHIVEDEVRRSVIKEELEQLQEDQERSRQEQFEARLLNTKLKHLEVTRT